MRKDRTQKPLEQTRLLILLKPHPNLTFVNSVKPSHMQKINKKKMQQNHPRTMEFLQIFHTPVQIKDPANEVVIYT